MADEDEQPGVSTDGATTIGAAGDQHGEVAAALDGIEAELDDVAAALSRMA